jgi:hypothetical protein
VNFKLLIPAAFVMKALAGRDVDGWQAIGRAEARKYPGRYNLTFICPDVNYQWFRSRRCALWRDLPDRVTAFAQISVHEPLLINDRMAETQEWSAALCW